MSRRVLLVVGIVAIAVLLGVATWRSLTSGTTPGTLPLAGDVRSDVRTVSAPAIQYPLPDVTVGIPTSSTAGSSGGGSRTGSSPPRSTQPTVSGMLEAVYVQQGDRVKAGQKIAQLNTTLLGLGVKQAKTAKARTDADIAVLGKNLDKVASNQDKLATARGKLATAAQQLATADKALAAGQAQLIATRAQLVAGISELEGVINGPHPPGPWPPPAAVAQLQQLKAGLVGVDTALAGLPVAKGQLALGKAQLATGKAQIATGATALRDAKKKLRKAQAVMKEVAKGKAVLVNLAEYRMSQAELRSPVDGIVTEARRAGTVAMVNAPIVRVRPDGPTQIETYLTGTQLGTVPVGSTALVDFDSNTAGPLSGKVTLVASNAEFPPTSFPTNIVHMTQTVKVRITLDEGGWAPPGTPVDVRIKTNSGR